MSHSNSSAKILDLNSFRKQRGEEQKYTAAGSLVPMLVWVPVWVFVPQPF